MSEIMSEREQSIIDRVVQALPKHLVIAKLITVHTQEGGESATLRLTADDTSSTDLTRERIEGGGESAEVLATEVETELKTQLGDLAH